MRRWRYTQEALPPLPLRFLFLITLAAFAVSEARAQDCPEDLGQGPRTVTPADGAAAVSRNAWVRVDFTEGYFADWTGALQDALELRTAEGELVAGEFELVGDETLFFRPLEALPQERRFDGVAYGLEGDLAFSFRTGRDFDETPPLVGEISSVSATAVGESCDAPDGGYRVDVAMEPAMDDGPVGSLRYQVYLSRSGQGDAPSLRAEVRGYAGQVITAAFVLKEAEVSTPVCLEVRVMDGVGRLSEDGAVSCFDPKAGQFFAGLCGVGLGGRAGIELGMFWIALSIVILRRRRNRV